MIPISLELPCGHSPAIPWSPSPMSPEHRPPATAWGSFHPGWSTSLHSSPCRWALCSRALTRNASRPDSVSAQWFLCSPYTICRSFWRDVWISRTRRCRRSGDPFLQLRQLVGFSSHVRLCLKYKIIGYIIIITCLMNGLIVKSNFSRLLVLSVKQSQIHGSNILNLWSKTEKKAEDYQLYLRGWN